MVTVTDSTEGLAARHLDRVLTAMAGPATKPRPDQLEAVAQLVEARRRVLLVQATGWGKSAVYWAATSALRHQGHGPTLVVSPLLALMRDQIDGAARAGLTAATVNSANVDDWEDVFARLRADEIDALLVSPERLANPRFADVALPLLAGAGLLVIDEAHCISDWGFDFRPDYQRVALLLARLAEGSPVLATTATANARVTADVAAQLGDDTVILRGPLARASLRLCVVPGLAAAERFAWVAEALDALPGSGIVYALTVDQAGSLAAFLAAEGHRVAAYTGQTDPEERAAIEAALRANELKAVVATSALGMGYDKPDLGFCVHVGSPASPVAYYQQVGRAGRALDVAVGVLLPAGREDERIWDYFATATIPDPAAADRVLTLLADAPPDDGLTLPAIEASSGVRRGRLEALLKTLRVDGAVDRRGAGWVATGQPWEYDAAKYERLVAARRVEAALMRSYAHGERCLMHVLAESLDDPTAGPCGRCSVCTGELPPPALSPPEERVRSARRFLRSRAHVLEPRKQWPGGAGRRGRLVGCEPGRAIAFADDAGWPEVVAEVAGPDRDPSDPVRQAAVETLASWARVWGDRPVAVIPLPSRARPQFLRGLAEHLAAVGRLPLLDALTVHGPELEADAAAGARVRALLESIEVTAEVPSGPVLLVTDTARTLWTITVAAALLREAGAGPVLPLVAHRLA
jgi:ATP-dependent DNA helicase RecQ